MKHQAKPEVQAVVLIVRGRQGPWLASCFRALVPLSLLFLASCATRPTPVPYARLYPSDLPRGKPLDIQVIKHDTTLELTNTTAMAFGPSTIWLNSYYSKPIDGLEVAERLELPLSGFRNEYSEKFRGGGFWATEAPERLVLAELETTGKDGKPVLLGLIVVGE